MRVLLPISLVAAVVLVLLGVVQNFLEPMAVHTLTGGVQDITGGPVASQEAIKELGTNGGGFYNANSAHPFENPTPFTDIFEIFLLLVIPFSMAWAFGIIVGDRRQGGAILAVMALLWAPRSRCSPGPRWPRPGTAPGARRRRDGGQGGPLRRGGVRTLRRRPRPAPRPVPSTRCTTRSPPPAAASRSST